MSEVDWHDVEMACQVVAAQLKGDDDAVTQVIRDNPMIGSALIGLCCSLAEQLASTVGLTAEELMDTMMIEASRLHVEP